MLYEQMARASISETAGIQSEAIRNRRYVVITFGLCVVMLFLSGLLSRDLSKFFSESPNVVFMISAALIGYAYAVLRSPETRTTDGLKAMNFGLKWGAAIGCVWLIAVAIEVATVFLALFFPLLCGALAAIRTGKVRSGTYSGLWCGVSAGLLGFLVFATADNFVALFPSLFARVDDEGVMGLAFFALVLYGPVFCPIAATIGGLIGIPLERTGRAPASPHRAGV